MGTHRILYQIALLTSLVFYVLYPLWFSGYLLVLLLLLMPFDLLVSLPGMLTKRVMLAAPKMLEQNGGGALWVVMTQGTWFPAGCVKMRLSETSDEGVVIHSLRCASELGSRYELAINTSRSGFTAFAFDRYWVTSLIGLFSIPVNASGRAGLLVMPAPQKPPRTLHLPRVPALRPVQSGMFSEEHDLRPFRKGDPIKSVHWKLSAKHDSLVVREPLLPIQHSRLIHISPWGSEAFERDLVLGRLRWVSNYLLKRGLHYYVRFEDSGPAAEITVFSDLIDYLSHMLDDECHEPPSSGAPPEKFSWIFQIDGADQ